MKEKRITLILSIALAVCAGATIPTLISSIPPVEPYSVKSEVPYCVTPWQRIPEPCYHIPRRSGTACS